MDLGVRLFEDRNYDAAISEFELAYEAKPVANPLINLALCHKGRFDYPRAVDFLERVLRDHRDTTESPEKIEHAIAELRELLATVIIQLGPPGIDAEVFLDGQPVAKAALGGLRVSPGGHEIVVRAEGYAEARAPFRVASGNERVVEIQLVSTSGKLAISGPDTKFRVSVDGVDRGEGPLQAVLPAGNHLLVIRRGARDTYTINVPVVVGLTTEVTLGDDGFLRMEGLVPRGPDEVVRPPVRGVYALAGAGGGLIVGAMAQPFLGFDVDVGYQVTNSVGIGLAFRQAFPVVFHPSTPTSYLESVTQLGPSLRLSTNTETARFVTVFDVGFSYAISTEPELANPDDIADGYSGVPAPGAWIGAEPGLDLEIDQFLFGFTTPLTVNVSADSSVQIFGRIHVGYGFW